MPHKLISSGKKKKQCEHPLSPFFSPPPPEAEMGEAEAVAGSEIGARNEAGVEAND